MKKFKIVKHFYILIFLKIIAFIGKLNTEISKKIIFLFLNLSFSKERSLALYQIKSCGLKEEKKILKKLITHLSKITFDLIFSKIDRLSEKRKIIPYNIKTIDKVLANNNGAIILTAHLGNWEYVAQYLSLNNYKMNAIARKNNSFEKQIKKIRSSNNVNIIYNDNAWKDGVKALKKNELLGIVADQYPKNSGVWSYFLGKKTFTAKGTALFSIKTKSPIIPCFMIASKKNYYFYVCKPIFPENFKGNLNKKIQKITDTYNTIMTKWILKYPYQWMWFHKRWK